MKKIIVNICLILIALTAVASVCACDADNCTVEVDLSENNVENIAVDEITDEEIADDIDGDVSIEKTINYSENDIIRENEKIHYKINSIKSKIVTNFTTNASDYKNPYIEHYTPQGVTPKLVDYIETIYGSFTIDELGSICKVSIGEIKDTIHEIKLGKHGEKLKKQFEEKDNENYQKIAELESKLIKPENHADKDKKSIYVGKYNRTMKINGEEITYYTDNDDDFYMLLNNDIKLPIFNNTKNKIIETIAEIYGTTYVSSMVNYLDVPEDKIIETIEGIKLGKYGPDLQKLLEQKDKENNGKFSVPI